MSGHVENHISTAWFTRSKNLTSLQFFYILNFVLQFFSTSPSETELMARFAKLGVGGGKTFDASQLTPETKAAIEQGIADSCADLEALTKEFVDGKLKSGDIFGTRAYLKNNYLYRIIAGALGIYGTSNV